jgi:hypothetical protein
VGLFQKLATRIAGWTGADASPTPPAAAPAPAAPAVPQGAANASAQVTNTPRQDLGPPESGKIGPSPHRGQSTEQDIGRAQAEMVRINDQLEAQGLDPLRMDVNLDMPSHVDPRTNVVSAGNDLAPAPPGAKVDADVQANAQSGPEAVTRHEAGHAKGRRTGNSAHKRVPLPDKGQPARGPALKAARAAEELQASTIGVLEHGDESTPEGAAATAQLRADAAERQREFDKQAAEANFHHEFAGGRGMALPDKQTVWTGNEAEEPRPGTPRPAAGRDPQGNLRR